MLHPVVSPDSAIADSQSFVELKFLLAASAAGTKHVLVAGQASAAKRLWLMTGDGSIDISASEANALVKGVNGEALSAEAIAASTLVQNYLLNIPAAADAAKCVAFALGGVDVGQVLSVQLRIAGISSSAANPERCLRNVSGAKIVQPLVDSAPSYSSDTLVIVRPQLGPSVLMGSLSIADVLDVPAAGEYLELVLIVKN